MFAKRILVTGASGFIGGRLVKQLVDQGHVVTCLVRKTSNTELLQSLGCRLVTADLVDRPQDLPKAVRNQELIYHLAAATRAVRSRDLIDANAGGTRNLYEVCAAQPDPPKVLLVSSMAAVGPSLRGKPHDEDAPLQPVSNYGRSKWLSEQIAREFSPTVSSNIIRPPIVFGDRDRDSLEMFRLIELTGWHLVPTFATCEFSVIHVDDLVTAMIGVAENGEVVGKQDGDDLSRGVYFAADRQVVTYSELGRMIGRALGRRRTRVLRIARPVLWLYALINEAKARIRGRSELLNIDKYREGVAGSWACVPDKLQRELGIQVARPLAARLRQTVREYRQRGWLASGPSLPTSRQRPKSLSDAS